MSRRGQIVVRCLVSFLASVLAVVPVAAQDDAATLEQRARTSYEQGDPEGALALYRQLYDRVAAPSKKVEVALNVAWLEYLDGMRKAAIDVLTEALSLDPGYPFRPELYDEDFHDLFLLSRQRGELLREHKATDRIEEGNAQMRAGDHEAARRSFQAALELSPEHQTAQYNLALVEIELERWDEALASMQKFLALTAVRDDADPELRARALIDLGYLYNRREAWEEAGDALREATGLAPENRDAWIQLGIARARLERHEEAIAAFARARALEGDDGELLEHLASSHLARGDHDAVVTLLGDAAPRLGRPRLWLLLGHAHDRRGDAAGARAAFAEARRTDDGDRAGVAAEAAVQLARLHLAAGEAAQALAEARQAVVWRPDLTDAWIFQGVAQEAVGELEAARASLEEAARRAPGRADVQSSLGGVYFRLGLYDLAEQAFEQTLILAPDFPAARANLDAVRAARGGG